MGFPFCQTIRTRRRGPARALELFEKFLEFSKRWGLKAMGTVKAMGTKAMGTKSDGDRALFCLTQGPLMESWRCDSVSSGSIPVAEKDSPLKWEDFQVRSSFRISARLIGHPAMELISGRVGVMGDPSALRRTGNTINHRLATYSSLQVATTSWSNGRMVPPTIRLTFGENKGVRYEWHCLRRFTCIFGEFADFWSGGDSLR